MSEVLGVSFFCDLQLLDDMRGSAWFDAAEWIARL